MRAWLHDGVGTTVSAAIASAFYAGPLVLMVLAGGGGGRERVPAALPALEGERVAVWLPDEPDGPEEEELVVLEPVLEDDGEAEDAVVVPAPRAGDPAEGAAGGMSGEESGTAEVGGDGQGTGRGDGVGAGSGRRQDGAPRVKRKRPSGCNRPHPNIREGSDGVMEVDRSLVDRYTKNLETFMRLGFSRPHDEGGIKGWYISGFSCVSVVHKAGFRRGDVLLSVNGRKTRSWIGVFMMYQKLKNKEGFEVEIVRKGQPMTLRFRVVEG